MIFQVASLQKNIQNRCENAFEKNFEKNLAKIDFGLHFGLLKPPEILPKSSEIPPGSDVERSLFRDAMEPARKSGEINGPQRL